MKSLFGLLLSLLVTHAVASVDPREAFQQAKAGTAILIDVREADEIKAGMIETARWFPLSKLQQGNAWKDELSQLTNGKVIYLYCRSGVRSGKASKILNKENLGAHNLGGYETLKSILPTTGTK